MGLGLTDPRTIGSKTFARVASETLGRPYWTRFAELADAPV